MLSTSLNAEDPKDTFKIMIATDIHLGYNEKDRCRGDDSFNSFEEVLRIAHERDVDFVLLGGDLFDASKPSQYTLQRSIDIIRKYTFSDKEIAFQIATTFENCDATLSATLRDSIPNINFYDENLNIGMPIFSIHGNHDDPCGMRSISSLDMLSSMGLVNYVGRWDKVDHLNVNPLVMRKGATSLALYGIGHMADKRLSRLFRDGKVNVTAVGPETAFQLLVMHQNRANRGVLNYIPFTNIPDFIDLAIWGHEHDSFIEPELVNRTFISQPGSTVATSLIHGESRPKHCGILYINGKQFHIEPVRLRTVRPFVHRVFHVPAPDDLDKSIPENELSKDSEQRVMGEIDQILAELDEERKNGQINDLLPLIRVVVHHYDQRQSFNEMRLALVYEGKVANPREMVLFQRIAKEKGIRFGRLAANGSADDDDDDDDDVPMEEDVTMDIGKFVERELQEKLDGLEVLTSSGICESLNRMVNCDDTSAFADYESLRKEKFLKGISEDLHSDDSDSTFDERLRVGMQKLRALDDVADVREMFQNAKMRASIHDDDNAHLVDSDDNHPPATPPAKPSSARGRGGRGRGRRPPKSI